MVLKDRISTWLAFARQKKPEPQTIFLEHARTDPGGLFAGWATGYAYNPSELISEKGVGIIDVMARDDQIKAAVNFKISAVCASGWTVKSPDGFANDWEITQFVQRRLSAMTSAVERVVKDVLSAMIYGYSVSEMIFEIVEQGPDAGKIGLKAVKTRRPHEIRFDIDEFGNLREDGIIQIDRRSGRDLRLPAWKFLLYAHNAQFGNPYGQSDLEAAYRAWWLSDNAYRWLGMLLQRFGVPPVFLLYNPSGLSDAQNNALRSIISNLQNNTSALIPRSSREQMEFWTPELAGQVSSVFVPAIQMCKQDIARALLMPGLLGITPDNNQGSLARAKIHFDAFILSVEYLQKVIAESVITEQLVKTLVDLNYQTDVYPRFEFLPLTDDTTEAMLSLYTDMVSKNILRRGEDDEHHIRRALGFPPPSDDPPASAAPGAVSAFAAAAEIPIDPVWLTPAARRVDFKAVAQHFDTAGAALTTILQDAFRAWADGQLPALISGMQDNIERAASATVTLPPDIQRKVEDVLLENYRQGRADLRREVTGQAAFATGDVNYEPEKAIEYLRTMALRMTSRLSEGATAAVRSQLILIIKNGLPDREAIARVRDALTPYIGAAGMPADRIENLIRTNVTEAYNQGRLIEARQPEMRALVHGMEYQAILDEVTTPICRHLHKKQFRLEDPELDRFTPPNHYRCRSILVPVVLDLELNPISESDIAKAKEFAPGEFGGSMREGPGAPAKKRE